MARSKITPDASDVEIAGNLTVQGNCSLTPPAAIPSAPAAIPSAPAAIPSAPAAIPSAPAAYDPGYYDDVGRDVEIPVLGLVNGVGPMSKQFRNQSGKFVLGDTLLGGTVEVIPVAVVKFFVEKFRNGVEIKYGSPEAATRKVFASAYEAAQAGYVVDFDNKALNRVEEAGRVGYLVIAPAGDESGEFVLKMGDLKVTLAKCSYQRGGFRGVFRKIFDHANKLALLKGITTRGLTHSELFNQAQAWDGVWSMYAEEPPARNGNTWFEPRIAKKSKLPAESVAWISENYGAVRA